MSKKIIQMPPLGESVTEATVATWLVEPGAKVKKYEPLMEAMSDKVTTEIPASDDGLVQELLVQEGETVPIGTDILVLNVSSSEPELEMIEEDLSTPSPTVDEPVNARYSPAVLKIASERNIDLQKVLGTGRHGRITRKDVLNYQPVPSAETESDNVVKMPTPVAEKVTESTQSIGDVSNSVPVSALRKTIAKNMLQSVTEIPQAWTMIEVDVTNLVKLRQEVKNDFKNKNGYSLSYFPFFVKAVSQALMNHPQLNNSWQNDTIVSNDQINMSIAVATEEALFTPVIQNANYLSIAGIASEINRLSMAVKDNKLTSQDMANGTFTANNTGSFGSVASKGILNAPQAGILQVEAIRKEVKVMPNDSIAIRSVVNLCLTIDHRLLDGLVAGRFLNEVKTNLENINENTNIY